VSSNLNILQFNLIYT